MSTVRIRFKSDIEARIAALPPGDQLRAQQLLEAFQARRLHNPLEAYVPHPKQVDLHAGVHNNRMRLFAGGNRAGKTTAGILDDIIQAAPAELVPEHLRPFKRFECPFYCRIMAPDFVSTMQPVIHQKLREWLPKDMLKGGSFDATYSKHDRTLRMECGCRFDFMTFEQSIDKFGGAALHRCHYDEEPPEDIRKECLMRLIDFGGDELFTMTPLMGMSWMFDGVWGRRHEDGIHVVVCDMDENPHLDEETKRAALDGLSEEEKQARKEGNFVHFGGLVYPKWRDWKTPAIKSDQLEGCDVVVGIDPGIRFTGVVWVAFDQDNRAVCFAAEKLTNATPEVVAEKIRSVNRGWGLGGDHAEPLYVIDPSARNRSLVNAQAVEGEYAACGIYTMHGQNDREAGVMNVRRRGEQGSFKWCGDLIDLTFEADRYRINDRPDGGFDVIKEHDHLLDALRYALMSRPWGPSVKPKPAAHRDPEVAWAPPKRASKFSRVGADV